MDLGEIDGKKKNKKGLPKSVFIVGGLFLGLPVIGLIGWYLMTAGLAVSGTNMSASELIADNLAKAQDAMRDVQAERAVTEGFKLAKVDECSNIQNNYNLTQRDMDSDRTNRVLIGLSRRASITQVNERCVVFAKVVQRMEKLTHHDNHTFVCHTAKVSTDASLRFSVYADKSGRGAVESFDGVERLIEIRRGRHTLVRNWQIFNLGDGCIIVGMSTSGVFTMSGS